MTFILVVAYHLPKELIENILKKGKKIKIQYHRILFGHLFLSYLIFGHQFNYALNGEFILIKKFVWH
jgi:hypothetical protein